MNLNNLSLEHLGLTMLFYQVIMYQGAACLPRKSGTATLEDSYNLFFIKACMGSYVLFILTHMKMPSTCSKSIVCCMLHALNLLSCCSTNDLHLSGN